MSRGYSFVGVYGYSLWREGRQDMPAHVHTADRWCVYVVQHVEHSSF